MAVFLFTLFLHFSRSALLVLLAVLGVTVKNKIVIIELGQLAIQALVALEFLGGGEHTATFGALHHRKAREGEREKKESKINSFDPFSKSFSGHSTWPFLHGILQWNYFEAYLVDKKRSHKFSWLEDIHNLADEIIVGCLGKVGFEANVGELWLWSDVDRPVSSL